MWTKENISDQTGKTVIVTGANTGIGFETALALYEKGATVIIACRNPRKGQEAIEKMKISGGAGFLEVGALNLANLSEIKKFTDDFKCRHKQLDILVNNAGVMIPPKSKTDDGFELQFGVNFIGHFALTGHLFSSLMASPRARVVTVGSGASTLVSEIDFENLKSEKNYDPNREYAISKLAGLQFAFEFDRKLKDKNLNILSTAVHPGVVYTDLQRHIAADELKTAFEKFATVSYPWQGALPSLFAATSNDIAGGDYYGPDGVGEFSGYPAPSKKLTGAEQDKVQGNKLWHYAEKVTETKFP